MLRAVDDVLEEIGAGDRRGCSCSTRPTRSTPTRREELRLRHPDGRARLRARPARASRSSRERDRGGLRARRCAPSSCCCPTPRAAGWPSCTTSPATSSARTPPRACASAPALPAPVAERFERFAVERPPTRGARLRRAPARRLGVRRRAPAAVLPARAHDGDAGLDLSRVEAVTLAPGERASVAHRPRDRAAARARRPGPAALGAGAASRHRARQRARADRRRLPRRGARAAAEHRPRAAVRVARRRPHRPARRRRRRRRRSPSRSTSSARRERGERRLRLQRRLRRRRLSRPGTASRTCGGRPA